MNANSNERPTAYELVNKFEFWYYSNKSEYDEEIKYGYKGKEIRAAFKEADKEIPNISTLYKKNSDAVYTKNNKDCDSQLVDLEVSNSIKLRDTTVDENSDD
ncbi:unnamed protein product [Rhizophagus irregularis]|nr:unnamed protein product [Rhizophagus irregularis]